ncbi:MAG: hypothetical protein KHX56_10785 [Clostridiales bacterium]|nr:hypothetical protein [Clostridiales bacterium]
MDMYNELIPLGMALAVFDDEVTKSRLENMTEAQKEELMNRAKDTKSGDELAAILNEISAHENG